MVRSRRHLCALVAVSLSMVALACALLVFAGAAHAQDSPGADDELTIPQAQPGQQTLVVAVQLKHFFIDHAATRLLYDGLDKVFTIEWSARGRRGALRIPADWLVPGQEVGDIYDSDQLGISFPTRFSPLSTPRLYPHLVRVREKWSKQFDDMAHASTQIAAIALVHTLSPVRLPLATASASDLARSPAARPAARQAPAGKSASTSVTAPSAAEASAAPLPETSRLVRQRPEAALSRRIGPPGPQWRRARIRLPRADARHSRGRAQGHPGGH